MPQFEIEIDSTNFVIIHSDTSFSYPYSYDDESQSFSVLIDGEAQTLKINVVSNRNKQTLLLEDREGSHSMILLEGKKIKHYRKKPKGF